MTVSPVTVILNVIATELLLVTAIKYRPDVLKLPCQKRSCVMSPLDVSRYGVPCPAGPVEGSLSQALA